MTYQHTSYEHAGYDYAPSIVWDQSTHHWVMYTCSSYTDGDGYASDGIFRSVSADRVHWSAPRISLPVSPDGGWDDRHVCDPSVLHLDGSRTIRGYRWAMWYTGIGTRESDSAGLNNVGLALSHDGISWIRLQHPIFDCSSLVHDGEQAWGCGQPSVVWDGSVYRMSHTEALCTASSCSENRLKVSTDGITWRNEDLPPFVMPQRSVGPDFVLGAGGYYYSVVGGNTACGAEPNALASELVVYRSPTMWADRSAVVKVGCLSYTDMTHGDRTEGRYIGEQGFYRTGSGTEPVSAPAGGARLWVAFGLGFNRLHDRSEEIRAGTVER